jgi:hypothetical protein
MTKRSAEARGKPKGAWSNANIFMPPLAAIVPGGDDPVDGSFAGSREGIETFAPRNGREGRAL